MRTPASGFRGLASGLAACALVFSISLAPGGCSKVNTAWTGSVDAVFRYRTEDATTVVHEVRRGTLSERAGVAPGDVLLSVDGTNLAGAPYEAVRAALRGPIGSVALLVLKRGDQVVKMEVERLALKQGQD